ncbi:MAG TPA: excinuclease ABC subunit UvrC [Actinomycetota bacterium]|nr:excinuclease ABC subunit UvrC [Actinomycetota bacterium]
MTSRDLTLSDLDLHALDFGRGERPDLRRVPDAPGVYLFRDGDGRVLYVGKARSVRKRVSNYFGAPSGLAARTQAMVASARRVEWVVVSGEVQALLVEYSLIQEHRPRFNVRYRDDKSYPYLAITMKDRWPKATVMRGRKRRGVRYYGPFAHVYAIRETVDSLTRVFPMRTCSESLFRECERLGRPCLYFHIGRCPGPCVGEVTEEEYRANVDAFSAFLDGDVRGTLDRLSNEMDEAAARLEFELAAKRRDQLAAARRALEKQEVVAKRPLDADVVGVASNELDVAVQLFFVRGGRIAGRKGYVAEVTEEQTDADRLTLLIQSVYSEREDVPPEVLVPHEPAEREALEEWLSTVRGARVRIRVPRTGERAAVLQTVTENAERALEEVSMKRRSDLAARSRALADLRDALGLPEAPLRIECFDISTLHGTETVGSMVVFEDGMPKRSDYRKFRVKQVEGVDDLRAMEEVVRRRFARHVAERDRPLEPGKRPARFAYRPQLVLIDGGRGQLGAAMKAMHDVGVTDIPVAALAKRLEEVYVPGQPEPVQIERGSEALYVLQHVRDEAHRSAVGFHRQRRDARMRASALDEIPGVGRTRKQALMKWFGSVENLQRATVDEIRAVPGIPRHLAEDIHRRLAGSAS